MTASEMLKSYREFFGKNAPPDIREWILFTRLTETETSMENVWDKIRCIFRDMVSKKLILYVVLGMSFVYTLMNIARILWPTIENISSP
jgi:hypothetical protein